MDFLTFPIRKRINFIRSYVFDFENLRVRKLSFKFNDAYIIFTKTQFNRKQKIPLAIRRREIHPVAFAKKRFIATIRKPSLHYEPARHPLEERHFKNNPNSRRERPQNVTAIDPRCALAAPLPYHPRRPHTSDMARGHRPHTS